MEQASPDRLRQVTPPREKPRPATGETAEQLPIGEGERKLIEAEQTLKEADIFVKNYPEVSARRLKELNQKQGEVVELFDKYQEQYAHPLVGEPLDFGRMQVDGRRFRDEYDAVTLGITNAPQHEKEIAKGIGNIYKGQEQNIRVVKDYLDSLNKLVTNLKKYGLDLSGLDKFDEESVAAYFKAQRPTAKPPAPAQNDVMLSSGMRLATPEPRTKYADQAVLQMYQDRVVKLLNSKQPAYEAALADLNENYKRMTGLHDSRTTGQNLLMKQLGNLKKDLGKVYATAADEIIYKQINEKMKQLPSDKSGLQQAA